MHYVCTYSPSPTCNYQICTCCNFLYTMSFEVKPCYLTVWTADVTKPLTTSQAMIRRVRAVWVLGQKLESQVNQFYGLHNIQ